MLHRPTLVIGLLFLVPAAIPDTAFAQIVTYTDKTAFVADLLGPPVTLDFDALTAGDLIADGGTVQGITFNYPTLAGFGVSLQVRADFDTTSPPNYLGTDDGGLFQGGDAFNLDFAASNAIGLTFLTADMLFLDDLQLTVGGTTVGLNPAANQGTLLDGTDTYFLGIIDNMTSFTSASITGSGAFFFYNVDDIVTSPVPEPSLLLLWLAALAAYGIRRLCRLVRATWIYYPASCL